MDTGRGLFIIVDSCILPCEISILYAKSQLNNTRSPFESDKKFLTKKEKEILPSVSRFPILVLSPTHLFLAPAPNRICIPSLRSSELDPVLAVREQRSNRSI